MSFRRRPESRSVLLKTYYVYILAGRRNGTLYTGVTNNLVRRVYEHKNHLIKGFTQRYGVHMLVYYEQCENAESAIQREKRLKTWHRSWKIRLIEETNPEWKDLYQEITGLDSSFRWNDNAGEQLERSFVPLKHLKIPGQFEGAKPLQEPSSPSPLKNKYSKGAPKRGEASLT